MEEEEVMMFHWEQTEICQNDESTSASHQLHRSLKPARTPLKSLTKPEKYKELRGDYLEYGEAAGSFNSD